jgi:hypothetical protein
MKTTAKIHLLLIATMIGWSACNQSEKLLETGQYDEAVVKSVAKIQKDKENEKNIDVLVKAYPKANDKNLERIDFLQKEGRPDRWEAIYNEYQQLKYRQDLVKTVMPLKYNGRLLEFEDRNYTEKLVESKRNAGDYYYNAGKQQMKENRKVAYRNAFYNFEKAKKFGLYTDIEKLLDESYALGQNKILINFDNQSRYKLPQDYEKQLFAFDFNDIDVNWNKHFAPLNQYNLNDYDYSARITLRNIVVSPQQIKENVITETKKVRDGWEYELDPRGNVKKDSLGNDIKIPKYKTIRCDVVESIQMKSIVVEGFVDIQQNSTRKLIKSYPITTQGNFQNISRIARGEIEALSEETRKTLGGQPVPFPDDFQMMFDAIPSLKIEVQRALKQAQSLYQF